MIERYYDPSEGVLEYMGHDIRSLNPHWYRDQIGTSVGPLLMFLPKIAALMFSHLRVARHCHE